MEEQLKFINSKELRCEISVLVCFLTVVFLFFACKQHSEFPLDPFFRELEKESPTDVIKQFKSAPLDSVVLNHKAYSAIFVDAAAIVFEDSSQAKLLEDFLEKNEMTGEQDLYTIIAAFHKRLHNEEVRLHDLRAEMIDLSNKYNERRYGKPDSLD